jgi:hypothetical protein
MPDVYARTLRRAANMVGGIDELAARLNVSREDLVHWTQGTRRAPPTVFLQAVDIVLEQTANPPD